MRLLITGGSGMLGSYTAVRAAEAGWETWATFTGHEVDLPGCHMVRLDIRDASETARVIAEIMPDVAIHTALVKPDICEERMSDAFAINVLGTANIIAGAEAVGAHLVHISTDTVFDGEHSPIAPDAHPSPVNYYGETKAAAEAAVRAARLNWAVVRTSIIYGPRKFPWLESFTDKIITALRAGQTFGAFVDQYRSPIPAWNLADALLEIAERRLTGDFHVVCPEPSTRFQFARKVAEILGLDQGLITALYMNEVHTPARRPRMLVLDTLSTQRALDTRLLGFEEGIAELRRRKC